MKGESELALYRNSSLVLLISLYKTNLPNDQNTKHSFSTGTLWTDFPFLFLVFIISHLSIHQWSVLSHPAACRRSEAEAEGEREQPAV